MNLTNQSGNYTFIPAIKINSEQNKSEQNKFEQNKSEQNKSEQNKSEQNKSEQNKFEQNKSEQNKSEQNDLHIQIDTLKAIFDKQIFEFEEIKQQNIIDVNIPMSDNAQHGKIVQISQNIVNERVNKIENTIIKINEL